MRILRIYFAALRLIANEPAVARWFKTKTERRGAVEGKQAGERMRRLTKGLWHQAHGRAPRAERPYDQHAVPAALSGDAPTVGIGTG